MQVDPYRHTAAMGAQRPRAHAVQPNDPAAQARPVDSGTPGVRPSDGARPGAPHFPPLDGAGGARGGRPLPPPPPEQGPERADPGDHPTHPLDPGGHSEGADRRDDAFAGTNDGTIGATLLAARFGEGDARPGGTAAGGPDADGPTDRSPPFGRLVPDDLPRGVLEMAEVQAMTGGEFLGQGGRVDLRA